VANNELSGPLVTTFLYRILSGMKGLRYDYRFVVVPETIGAITFLHQEGDKLKKRCAAGFVVNCCGTTHPFTYKKSRRATHDVDRITQLVLKWAQVPHSVVDFFPSGSDERQYCSPGFNLPVGSLMRAMYGTYPEYHTSLDNKSFISFKALRETIKLYLKVLFSLEENRVFKTTVSRGEPHLSPRGLYPTLGSQQETEDALLWMMYLINYSDGKHDLCSIAELAGCGILDLASISKSLLDKDLLRLDGAR
jgi:aminopeptidase-like protein